MFESYRLDGAERVIVAINSVAGEIKEVIDDRRAAGDKVGLLKIRVFRPFPYAVEALKNAKIVTVLDRSESMGAHGPLFCEIRTALFDTPEKPLVYSGPSVLGAGSCSCPDIHDIFEENKRYLETGTVEKTAEI
ncbi:MAG: hypothetical protein R2874_15215 [Desulfobacterales bacterium]